MNTRSYTQTNVDTVTLRYRKAYEICLGLTFYAFCSQFLRSIYYSPNSMEFYGDSNVSYIKVDTVNLVPIKVIYNVVTLYPTPDISNFLLSRTRGRVPGRELGSRYPTPPGTSRNGYRYPGWHYSNTLTQLFNHLIEFGKLAFLVRAPLSWRAGLHMGIHANCAPKKYGLCNK